MDLSWLDLYSEKLKALGHPVRLKLVMGLMGNECNVTKICKGLKIPQATTSQHLAILKNKGIIKGRRDGTSICYSIEDDAIKKLLKILMEETGCDMGDCHPED
jgi:ArsR family transcriptional regulator